MKPRLTDHYYERFIDERDLCLNCTFSKCRHEISESALCPTLFLQKALNKKRFEVVMWTIKKYGEMTTDQVCNLTGYHKKVITDLIAANLLPHRKVKNYYVIGEGRGNE